MEAQEWKMPNMAAQTASRMLQNKNENIRTMEGKACYSRSTA